MFWDILEIKPTTDKKLITRAYREKLVNTNPEDKPEQFKALREAYEAALAYAESGGIESKSEIELFSDELAEIYNDFTKRKNVQCWKDLFNKDVCKALGSKIQVEEVLLHFIMDHYFISHEVWLIIEQQFSLCEKVEELYDSYPKDFIDYIVLNGIYYDDILPFDMFIPGINGEECQTYLNIYQKIRNSDEDQIEQLIDQLNELEESHPFGDGLILLHDIQLGKDRIVQLKELVEKYNYERRLALLLANAYFEKQEYELSERTCRKALENAKDDSKLLWRLSNAIASQGKYKDAIDIIHDLMRLAGGDQAQLETLNEQRSQWNEKLIEDFSVKYQQDPSDVSLKIDYGWALIQNEKFELADEITKDLKLEQMDPFDYYNLMGNIDFCCERIEEGLEKQEKLIEVIENMVDDGTEKTQKRIARLSEMYSRKAYYLCMQNQQQKGMEAYKKALEIDLENPDILTQLSQISMYFKNYEDTIKYAKALVEVKPNAYHGYLLMARAMYKMRNDRDAFENVNKAIDYYAGSLDAYTLKLKILIRNQAKEASEELLAFLENNNCGEDLTVMFCKGMIEEFFHENDPGALEIYQKVIERLEQNEYVGEADAVYYRYLCLIGMKRDANVEADRNEMLEIAEKGLLFNTEHYGLLDYKAWLLKKAKRDRDALEIYLKLTQYPNYSDEVDAQIGDIYYYGDDDEIEKAVEYYLKAYEKGNTSVFYSLSYAYYFMDNIDQSEKFALLLRERAENEGVIDIDSHVRMSYVYEKRKQFSKAFEENEIALENALKKKVSTEPYLRHKIRLYRLMNQFDEAMDTVKKMAEQYQSKDEDELLIEICMQAGRYESAKKIIKKCLAEQKNPSLSADKLIRLQILTGHMAKAKFQLFDYKAIMNEDTYLDLSRQVNHCDLKFDKSLEAALKSLEVAIEKKERLAFPMIRVAEIYDDMGEHEKAVKYANSALESYNEYYSSYSTIRSIFDILAARIYITLRDFEKAQQYIQHAANNVCSNCNYCQCKDADIYTVRLLEKQGLIDQAINLCQNGLEKWLDDEDFVIIMNRLKKEKR